MILYFSGTGNSEYAAKRIAEKTEDEVLNLFEKIKNRDFSMEYPEINHPDSPWVIVVPTYAWRIPRIVQEWLEKTKLPGSRAVYFVMTCGGNVGNAGKYLRELCRSIKMDYRGCFQIVMPENYIAMFSSPSKEEALEIIRRAEGEIDRAAAFIKSGRTFPQLPLTVKDKMNSGIVNDLFYPMFVHAKKFYAADTCISCGKCAAVCPLTNIRLENGRPVWGNDCTHCMACICRCPVEAIEYGKHSIGLTRYTCPK